jgi:hypothetical protein
MRGLSFKETIRPEHELSPKKCTVVHNIWIFVFASGPFSKCFLPPAQPDYWTDDGRGHLRSLWAAGGVHVRPGDTRDSGHVHRYVQLLTLGLASPSILGHVDHCLL